MNQPSDFGNIMVRFLIFGLFPGPVYREPFSSFVSNPYELETNSPIGMENQMGTVSNIDKNKGASVQLSQYYNVSLSSIPKRIRAYRFIAQPINTGKLS